MTSGEENDVLFTVIDDNSSVIQLDTSKTILETVPIQNDLVIEKYYQYGSDVKLVDDVVMEGIKLKDVDLNSSSVINSSMSVKEEIKIETDDDLKETLDVSSLEPKRIGEEHVMELTSECLESYKPDGNDDPLSYETTLPVVSEALCNLPEQENIGNDSLYPNIVLGYIEGGKPVRLKVHKITRSERTASKLESVVTSSSSLKEETHRCKECNAFFRNKKELEVHLEDHLVKKQKSCALCNVEFPSKAALQLHIKQHFSKAHTCDICYDSFATRGLLNTHKARKHVHSMNPTTSSVDHKVNNITVVSKTLQPQQNGSTPTVAIHKVKPPIIHHTPAAYPPNSITTNNNNVVKILKCSLCDAVFSTRSAMKQHSTSHHHKPYKCDQCGATFTQNGSLQVHIRRHRGEKPFTCNLCGNSYTRAFSLKVSLIICFYTFPRVIKYKK